MTSKEQIAHLAEQIAWLSADELWDLSKELIQNYPVPANILRSDLEIVE